ncbi:MAG: hypothetical protein JO115_04005 [Pseudonocardiales bacterium]|nr:hypothetical protein [Pseudonocardiales bacterium]
MRLLQRAAKTNARFDDPNLVSHAGLVPAVRLAANVGREDLVTEHVHVSAEVGANPGVKIGSLVAGMTAGAEGIEGMDLLRHGAIPATFGESRAPSTLGSFLRAFTPGTVRQLAAVHRRVLPRLAAQAPLLPGADTLAFVDVDSVQRRVYGATKQGVAFGHAKIDSKSLRVRGRGALRASMSTPLAAPVVTTARLRGGNAGSSRGAANLLGRGHRPRAGGRCGRHDRGARRGRLLRRGVQTPHLAGRLRRHPPRPTSPDRLTLTTPPTQARPQTSHEHRGIANQQTPHAHHPTPPTEDQHIIRKRSLKVGRWIQAERRCQSRAFWSRVWVARYASTALPNAVAPVAAEPTTDTHAST